MGSAQKFTNPTRSSWSCGGGINASFGVTSCAAVPHIEIGGRLRLCRDNDRARHEMPDRHLSAGQTSCRTSPGAHPRQTDDRAGAPRLRVTMGMAARSSAETRDYSRFPQASMAAFAMCFDQVPEKQNRYALQFFGPRVEANPRNSVRLSTASKETASSGRNDREKSDRSKKRRSTPGSKADSDQANSRAHYTSITGF